MLFRFTYARLWGSAIRIQSSLYPCLIFSGPVGSRCGRDILSHCRILAQRPHRNTRSNLVSSWTAILCDDQDARWAFIIVPIKNKTWSGGSVSTCFVPWWPWSDDATGFFWTKSVRVTRGWYNLEQVSLLDYSTIHETSCTDSLEKTA